MSSAIDALTALNVALKIREQLFIATPPSEFRGRASAPPVEKR